MPSGAMGVARGWRTSWGERNSMGIFSPVSRFRSKVLHGAAT